jgi:hypothetical protein
MRKVRLAILGSSPCHLCTAACCKQNGTIIRCCSNRYEHARFRPFSIDLTVMNGTHAHHRACHTVSRRADACFSAMMTCARFIRIAPKLRNFECVNGYGGSVRSHSRFLELNPQVRRLLDTF